MAIVADESTRRRVLIRLPLTEAETIAVSLYGDRVFGKSNVGRKLKDDDVFGLYDFFLDSYRDANREGLLRAVKDHPQLHDFEQMDLEALRTQVCRELTRSMYVQTLERRQQRKRKAAGAEGGSSSPST